MLPIINEAYKKFLEICKVDTCYVDLALIAKIALIKAI